MKMASALNSFCAFACFMLSVDNVDTAVVLSVQGNAHLATLPESADAWQQVGPFYWLGIYLSVNGKRLFPHDEHE